MFLNAARAHCPHAAHHVSTSSRDLQVEAAVTWLTLGLPAIVHVNVVGDQGREWSRESENQGRSQARVVQGIRKIEAKPGLGGPGNQNIRTEAGRRWPRESDN